MMVLPFVGARHCCLLPRIGKGWVAATDRTLSHSLLRVSTEHDASIKKCQIAQPWQAMGLKQRVLMPEADSVSENLRIELDAPRAKMKHANEDP